MTATLPVVIIGSGMAAYGVARQFRKLDKTTPLTMVSGGGADRTEGRRGTGRDAQLQAGAAAAGQPWQMDQRGRRRAHALALYRRRRRDARLRPVAAQIK
ncbi:hypothetical protein CR103_01030 [Massilia psychrophila]|uniref:FAD/NAD(P)-binding domain-containing protein n=1 Tax=Massilia psychrophila TaxID=1603353 RepID=A0A2G8T6G3_9BURK|nr:hypothetical protein CR103_01030 [Massilia psychrophila]